MPKEGRTTKSSAKSSRAKKATPAANHRTLEVVGIVLIALALVLIVGLSASNGGLLGDSVAQLSRILFGRGAWIVPAVLGLSGLSLIFGRAQIQSRLVAWGASLTFLGVLAALAKPDATGDYFVSQAMESSGGYFGAIVGWALSSLFGEGKVIGVFAMIVIGLLLCLNIPIRETIQNIKDASKEEKITKGIDKAKAKALKQEEAALSARMNRRSSAAVVVEEDEPKPEVKKPKIAFQTPEPSEPITQTGELDFASYKNPEPENGYQLPPLDLLVEPDKKGKKDPKEVQQNIEKLEDTLEEFNIDANVVAVAQGPTITRYEIQLGPGIRVNKIVNLADNIAMSLAASHVRVEAPIPGKSAIGIEIPSATRQMVSLREMCDSLEFHDKTHKLCIALGKDVAGANIYTDLTRMPHLLVGGATNSGKSICLSSLIMSLILKMTPKELKLVMIDPKRVELTLFEGLPHLMCPVVKDVKESAGVLRAVVREMDRRYDKFSEAGVRNIDGWNAKASYQDQIPYIVVIVDELADLMIQCGNEVETSICRLAQLARAVGIHLVIATQRPSVDVITGTIKNNISSRVAFAVSSGIDSRTILDSTGAEDLIGRGDMLFLPIDATKPIRIQGNFVSEKEIEDVCDFWRKQEKPHYVLNPVQIVLEERESEMREAAADDPLFEDVVRFVVGGGQASTSTLQRKFSIGFQRAGRIMDMMEERNIIGPKEGTKPRQVLVDPMQAEALLGNAQYENPMPEGAYLEDED
ncbi:MAG: DNA translocase FtsK [Fimbriimonadaceae bacterium]